jgi:hypothetical protein
MSTKKEILEPYLSRPLCELYASMRNRQAFTRYEGSDELRDCCDAVIIVATEKERAGEVMADGVFKLVPQIDPITNEKVRDEKGRIVKDRVQMSLDEVKERAWRCLESCRLLLVK